MELGKQLLTPGELFSTYVHLGMPTRLTGSPFSTATQLFFFPSLRTGCFFFAKVRR